MDNWLNRSGSLNWANRKKLSNQIKALDGNIASLKESLKMLGCLVDHWSEESKALLTLESQHLLTAKHILHLAPLLERVGHFKANLAELNDIYQAELAMQNESQNTPSLDVCSSSVTLTP